MTRYQAKSLSIAPLTHTYAKAPDVNCKRYAHPAEAN